MLCLSTLSHPVYMLCLSTLFRPVSSGVAVGSSPSLGWLMGEASRVPDQAQFHDGHTDVCNVVKEGWGALREVMRTWGIEDRSDLSEWLGRRGFPRTTAGNHISARVQEVILSEASASDARVALVEAACVAGRAGAVRDPEVVPPVPRRTRQTEITAESWAQLDLVDLSEVFLERIPMLKTCTRFLRGRLRFSFAFALRERYRAKLEGDMVGANWAWTFRFGSHFAVEQASTHWFCRAGRVGKES